MLILCFLYISQLHAQQSAIDSINSKISNLKKERPLAYKDTTYIYLLYELGGKYRYISNDSLYAISSRIQQLSEEISRVSKIELLMLMA